MRLFVIILKKSLLTEFEPKSLSFEFCSESSIKSERCEARKKAFGQDSRSRQNPIEFSGKQI